MRLNSSTENTFTEEFKLKVVQWYKLQKLLKISKAEEMSLRKHIVSALTNNATLKSKTIEIAGFELKAELKVTYSVDKEAISELYENLTWEEKDCVKWTPSIKIKEYNALPITPSESTLKTEIVTVKPAAPTLTVISQLE